MRNARFRSGMGGIWDRVRGEHNRIRKLNMSEAYQNLKRDRLEIDNMIHTHLKERQRITGFKLRMRTRSQSIQRSLDRDKQLYSRGPEL